MIRSLNWADPKRYRIERANGSWEVLLHMATDTGPEHPRSGRSARRRTEMTNHPDDGNELLILRAQVASESVDLIILSCDENMDFGPR